VVTRDRASAYAKVISEVLPDTMQIADRFHLHQNLLKTIKDVLTREVPNKIAIPEESIDNKSDHESQQSEDKKKRTE
jgi:transposase